MKISYLLPYIYDNDVFLVQIETLYVLKPLAKLVIPCVKVKIKIKELLFINIKEKFKSTQVKFFCCNFTARSFYSY